MQSKAFVAKDGRKVVIRPPTWEDLEGLMEYINSLIDEKLDIMLTERVTREEEAEWLAERLVNVDKGDFIHVVAEVSGEIIAGAEVEKQKHRMSHVGVLGIGITSRFRGIGIGTFIMETLIEESKKAGLKILVLNVFDTNDIAKKLYKKIGFKEAGKIPKGIRKNGRYIDLVRMTLELS
ncbi:MAG: GNAT family N-acetyltransferase [Candidatus Bathyarchaeota archaeon]|nr:MAG: GNAT family N-acetyltransferase [Candidatus Bathyarchaeota archaeon]